MPTAIITSNETLEKIIETHRKNFPDVVAGIEKLLRSKKNIVASIDFNVVDSWIHITVIETDFFGGVRMVFSQDKKPVYNDILSIEEDAIKAAIQDIKNKYKNVSIFTIGVKNEIDKNKYTFSSLPRKLGFKKISIPSLEKIFNKRNISIEDISKKTYDNKTIWWANRGMLNEGSQEFTKIIREYLRS